MRIIYMSLLTKFALGSLVAICVGCSIASSSGKTVDISEITPVAESQPASAEAPKGLQTAVLAGGCFWGLEAVFEHMKGVVDVKNGYVGGDAKTADYETVSTGETDHAEAVQIVFDPSKVTYNQLLDVFFSVAHDPTELNRQGPDSGRQYRSGVFFTTEEQKAEAIAFIAKLENSKVYSKPIVTEVSPMKKFFTAEAYHQDYMKRNPSQPYIVINDRPKVEDLHKKFPEYFVAKYVAVK